MTMQPIEQNAGLTGTLVADFSTSEQIDGAASATDFLPVQGHVRFTPTAQRVLHRDSGQVILPKTVTATIGADGTMKVTLLATDAPGTNPTGWTYKVEILVEDMAPQSFHIAVPAGTTTDLTSLMPVAESNGRYIVQGEKGEDADLAPSQYDMGLLSGPNTYTMPSDASLVTFDALTNVTIVPPEVRDMPPTYVHAVVTIADAADGMTFTLNGNGIQYVDFTNAVVLGGVYENEQPDEEPKWFSVTKRSGQWYIGSQAMLERQIALGVDASSRVDGVSATVSRMDTGSNTLMRPATYVVNDADHPEMYNGVGADGQPIYQTQHIFAFTWIVTDDTYTPTGEIRLCLRWHSQHYVQEVAGKMVTYYTGTPVA